jgi:GTP-binding protein HflX
LFDTQEYTQEDCILVHVDLSHVRRDESAGASGRYADQALLIEEAQGLARAIHLDILHTHSFKPKRIYAGAFLGQGQRADIKELVEAHQPDVLIFNGTLSPVQQRNLEKEWGVKVIDRTGLILEIFGERAQTKEGKLQVELAMLDYQRSRLVRSWTHLERQRGGAGFMGGPGETQIELDRRIIAERMVRLKKDLEDVRRTRDLGRQSRARVPFPVVALVGYTNAGKSTLFNRMTGANVMAEDLLFATLDPTMRKLALDGGQEVILSDTVGFISDLPTHLVAAFRSTLEQVIYADVILHVMDVSHDGYEAQRADVIKILKDLGVEYDQDERVVEVWNKIDIADDERKDEILRAVTQSERKVAISALQGRGLDQLEQVILEVLLRSHNLVDLNIPVTDGQAMAWLYSHAHVVEREDGEQYVHMRVMMDSALRGQFYDRFGYGEEFKAPQQEDIWQL